MIPKHWNFSTVDRFSGNNFSSFHRNESVIDAAKQKVITNAIARRVRSYKVLFDLNLEERRNKLWNLLSTEESDMIKELESKFETFQQRCERLKQNAKTIRYQKEIERQNLAKEKYNQSIKENDPVIREINQKLYNAELIKDRKQLEIYKEIQKRQEECESKFWYDKWREEETKQLERQIKSESKQTKQKSEILQQIQQQELLKTQEKQQKQEENRINNEQIKLENEKIKLDKIKNQKDTLKQKLSYKTSLDKQIQYKNCLQNKQKELENSFEQIISNENQEIMKQQSATDLLKKSELNKHFVNYANMVKCIEKERKQANQQLDAEIIQTQIDLEKKRLKFDNESKKKFVSLIKSIKDYQKYQLEESEHKKLQENQEKLKESKIMELKLQNELVKDEQEKEQKKLLVQKHNQELMEQIKFNDYLKELNKKEKNLEQTKMQQEELRYQELLKDIRDRETLSYQHPWRLK